MSGSEFLNLSLDEIIAKNRTSRPKPRASRPEPKQGSGPRKFLSKSRGPRPSSQPNKQQKPVKYIPVNTPKANLSVKAGGIQKRPSVAKYIPVNVDSQSSRRGQGRSENVWQHDKFDGGKGASQPPRKYVPITSTPGFKIYITNLHHAVSSDDVLELFSSVGSVKSHRVNFDSIGRSLGTAEVSFSSSIEAERAKQQYDGVALDGQKMSISLQPGGAFVKKLSSGIRVERPGSGSARGGGRPFSSGAGRNRVRSVVRQ